MKILALELATHHRTVAFLDTVSSKHQIVTATGHPRATKPLVLIERCLAEAGVERREIDCIAVGLGPGSYTGVRSAIALAQGWQLATNVKLIGISTACSLAEEARATGWRGPITIVIDAQRDELYLANYDLDAAEARIIEGLRLAAISSVTDGPSIAGPEALQWFPHAKTILPSALRTAMLAARRNEFVSGEELEPIYLRPISYVKAPPPRLDLLI